ncbi:hypothetical protein AT05_06545 [Schleiferia thermophila str. Yellowstone]|nr:hypothetical protein AT05_06545 [Schleiferia thermophila str. Yellowstone]
MIYCLFDLLQINLIYEIIVDGWLHDSNQLYYNFDEYGIQYQAI